MNGRLMGAALSLSLVLGLTGCPTEPPKEPPLVADPPEGAGDGPNKAAANTELERGIAFIKNEKYDDAKEHLNKAIEIEPGNASARAYLGIALEKTGDRAGAEAAYKKALEMDPGLGDAAENLSALYLDDPARPDDAIAILKPALAKSPDNAKLVVNLAYAYGLKHDVEASSKAYETALTRGEDAQTRFAYGTMLFENKQHEKAAVQLKKALDGTKDDAPLLVTLGRMLGASKAYDACVTAFDRAIKLKATEPEWFVRRGTCRHELKDEPGAQSDYQAAIKIDPKFAAAHYYLGLSFLVDKKQNSAVSELEEAAKDGAGTPIGKQAKAKLDELGAKNKKKK